MITSFFIGASVAFAFNSLKLWFDKVELNTKLKEVEFELSVLSQTIDKLIEEQKNGFSND